MCCWEIETKNGHRRSVKIVGYASNKTFLFSDDIHKWSYTSEVLPLKITKDGKLQVLAKIVTLNSLSVSLSNTVHVVHLVGFGKPLKYCA